MRIFLINLKRRPDRLNAMNAAGARLGLTLTRIEARDARTAGPLTEYFSGSGPLGEIPRGDKACLISHRLAWQQFIESADSHAAILEDDVMLSPAAARFLKDASWVA